MNEVNTKSLFNFIQIFIIKKTNLRENCEKYHIHTCSAYDRFLL
jgi:hypothetical protein